MNTTFQELSFVTSCKSCRKAVEAVDMKKGHVAMLPGWQERTNIKLLLMTIILGQPSSDNFISNLNNYKNHNNHNNHNYFTAILKLVLTRFSLKHLGVKRLFEQDNLQVANLVA